MKQTYQYEWTHVVFSRVLPKKCPTFQVNHADLSRCMFPQHGDKKTRVNSTHSFGTLPVIRTYKHLITPFIEFLIPTTLW